MLSSPRGRGFRAPCRTFLLPRPLPGAAVTDAMSSVTTQACAQEIERIRQAIEETNDPFGPVMQDYIDAEDDLLDEIEELKVRPAAAVH